MYQFKLPDLAEGIAEVEVVEWLVREGDAVQEDQPLVAVQTDKVMVEISSPRAGRIHRLCAKAGDMLPVGEVLLEIDDSVGSEPAPVQFRPAPTAGAAETAPETRTVPQAAARATPHQAPAAGEPQPVSPPPRESSLAAERTVNQLPPRLPPRPQGRPSPVAPERRQSADAVPAVRDLAQRLGVDIERVAGTGPGGRVMRRDVEAVHAEIQRGGPVAPAGHVARTEAPAADESDWIRQPLRGVRRVIAERMVRSKTLIPHYTLVEEVDVTALEERRTALAERTGQEALSPLAFIAHAAVRVLPGHPQMNACLDEHTGEVIVKGRIHLGIAVDTEDGLLVPVIRDATGQDVAGLAARIRDLSERARARRLVPSELTGATFTVTSLGKLGGLMATPIINYPASAILGVHAIRTLPRYVGDQVAPRRILNLSVSLDHRIVDGADGGRFIHDVRAILEQADFPGIW